MTRYWVCERHHNGNTVYREYSSQVSAERACMHLQQATERSGVPVSFTVVVAEGVPV